MTCRTFLAASEKKLNSYFFGYIRKIDNWFEMCKPRNGKVPNHGVSLPDSSGQIDRASLILPLALSIVVNRTRGKSLI